MEVTRGQFRAVRRMFQKFPLQFLNSLLGCLGCMGSVMVMMKQYPLASWSGSFLRVASRSFNRTSQYVAEFTFSTRFWKWDSSTSWECQNTVSITLLIVSLLGGGVQLGPLGTAATDWPIVACPGWLWWWRIWWNEDWQGKAKYSKKTRPSATLFTTNPTWRDPGSNPGRRGGKPATNRLSYGAAFRSGREGDHSPPTNAEAKKTWSYTSIPSNAFMA
jgi:hypothetical protein